MRGRGNERDKVLEANLLFSRANSKTSTQSSACSYSLSSSSRHLWATSTTSSTSAMVVVPSGRTAIFSLAVSLSPLVSSTVASASCSRVRPRAGSPLSTLCAQASCGLCTWSACLLVSAGGRRLGGLSRRMRRQSIDEEAKGVGLSSRSVDLCGLAFGVSLLGAF